MSNFSHKFPTSYNPALMRNEFMTDFKGSTTTDKIPNGRNTERSRLDDSPNPLKTPLLTMDNLHTFHFIKQGKALFKEYILARQPICL